MYAYNEPGITNYTPHPAFYHLYYFRRFCGDVLLNSSMTGDKGLVIIPTAFSSGQVGAAIINTGGFTKVIRLNISNFKFGDRYYTYTLTGTEGEVFSRKVYVNGSGNSLVAGGPENYETLKANSSAIGDEIKLRLPGLSATYILVEHGTRDLVVNNEVPVHDLTYEDGITIFPNPARGSFRVKNIPAGISGYEIMDIYGQTLYKKKRSISDPEENIETDLMPGIYFVTLKGGSHLITRKLIINLFSDLLIDLCPGILQRYCPVKYRVRFS
jgi:hypothetical protein